MFHTLWSSVTRSKLDQMDCGSSVDPCRAMERFPLSVSNLVISSSPPDWLLFLFTSSVTFRETRGEDPDLFLSGIIHIYASLGSFRSVKDVWGSGWRWGCSSVWRGRLRTPLQITASHNSDCQQTHEGSQETTVWTWTFPKLRVLLGFKGISVLPIQLKENRTTLQETCFYLKCWFPGDEEELEGQTSCCRKSSEPKPPWFTFQSYFTMLFILLIINTWFEAKYLASM